MIIPALTPGRPIPPPPSPQVRGCTYERRGRRCDTQMTVTVDGHHGRRCVLHPPADPFADEREPDCA